QKLDLTNYRKQKEIDFQFDKELIRVRESYNTGGGSGGGITPGVDTDYVPTSQESKQVESAYSEFDKFVSSKEFARMTEGAKYNAIIQKQEEIINNASSNLYGKNSMYIGDLILSKIENHPT